MEAPVNAPRPAPSRVPNGCPREIAAPKAAPVPAPTKAPVPVLVAQPASPNPVTPIRAVLNHLCVNMATPHFLGLKSTDPRANGRPPFHVRHAKEGKVGCSQAIQRPIT